MKKQVLVFILLAVLVVSCLALTACHSCEFGEWTIETQPTCTTEGLKKRVCSCGETQTEVIAGIGHTFGDWTTDVEPTCSAEGNRYQVCVDCGETQSEPIPTIDHDYGEWTLYEEPTCFSQGQEVRTCKCGAEEYRYTDPSAHTDVSIVTAPTCTESGYTTHTCQVCGDVRVDSYVDSLGKDHTYKDGACVDCGDVHSKGLDYRLSLDGSYYIVAGMGECTQTEIAPLAVYGDKPVTEIDGFALDSTICSITIPSSIQTIRLSAFMGCSNLTSIIFEEDSRLKTIGPAAFQECTSLAGLIQIPNSVVTIDSAAFWGCEALEEIFFENGSQLTTIGASAFLGTAFEEINFANNSQLTTIGEGAFLLCQRLKSIALPASLITMDAQVFLGCAQLAIINVDANNTAFTAIDNVLYTKDLSALVLYPAGKTSTTFDVPNQVKVLGDYAFYMHKYIASVTLSKESQLQSIGDYVFNGCENLSQFSFNNLMSLQTIGQYSFSECAKLADASLPDCLISIGKYAFNGCKRITQILIPQGVTVLSESVFGGCEGLYSVSFAMGNQLTTIQSYAFYGCSGLTRFSIGAQVTSIGEQAFGGCSELDNLFFADVDGWYVTSTPGASSGTEITLSTNQDNATYMLEEGYQYYWYKAN